MFLLSSLIAERETNGEDHAYQEDRKRKFKQQDGRARKPLEQQQVEQRFEPQFVRPQQQFKQGQLQPQQSPLGDCTIPTKRPGSPRALFVSGKVRLSPSCASH